jgi:hypothetical protein
MGAKLYERFPANASQNFCIFKNEKLKIKQICHKHGDKWGNRPIYMQGSLSTVLISDNFFLPFSPHLGKIHTDKIQGYIHTLCSGIWCSCVSVCAFGRGCISSMGCVSVCVWLKATTLSSFTKFFI